MKKLIYSLLSVSLLSGATVIWAQSSQSTAGPALRPTQMAMQARLGWMKAMNANLAEMKYEEVAKDADALSSQTAGIAKKLGNPLAKELTMRVSTLASEVSNAAAKQDGDTVKMKLADIKATCGECHAKIRDKK